MTGILDSLRSWVASLFGTDDDAEQTDESAAKQTPEAPAPDRSTTRPSDSAPDSTPDPAPATAQSSAPQSAEPSATSPDSEPEQPSRAESSANAPASSISTDSGTTDDGYDHQCAVCGTGVEAPNVSCPLCHSTEVVPTDATVEDADEASATQTTSATRMRTEASERDDAAVERLQDVRQTDE